jgi:hypothetical protein
MTITVVTGWHPAGFSAYANKFCETFARYWPPEIRCCAYVEERVEGLPPRIEQRSLWLIDGARAFLDRNGPSAAANGREPTETWKDKEREAKYSFRFDACKFFKQLIIPHHAAWSTMTDGEILCWLDADVVSFRKVPADLVSGLLGDADLCFLGREPKHSEIGFWAVRLNSTTREFLKALSWCYLSEGVFMLAEWHSAYVFDHVRREFAGRMKQRNLTLGGGGHVWFKTPLGKYMDHLKGEKRKRLGHSLERVHAAR